jgi:hypothetical protein
MTTRLDERAERGVARPRTRAESESERLLSGGAFGLSRRFRRIENLHILLWLLKDACWAMNLRWAGVFMILPTLTVAMLITWQVRHRRSEWLHNLAVVFWITANATWMVGEFFGWDEGLIGSVGLRQFSIVPFSIGVLLLVPYYLERLRRVSRVSRRRRKVGSPRVGLEG